MRADRLVAALLVLQARGSVTAAELATELEVSVATARRDLEALSTAGVPVYAQAGRGGGWRLLGQARTNLSGLTQSEARALFLLLGPGATKAPETRSALRKLLRALPKTFRTEAAAAADSIVVDAQGWGGAAVPRPDWVELLQTGVIQRRVVRIRYAGRTSGQQDRLVAPWGLVDKGGHWYLVAGTDAGRRTFRVDRIEEATLTAEVAQRPDDFDLQEAWDEVVETMEDRRSVVSAEVLVAQWLAPIVLRQFGRNGATVGSDGDRARLRVAAHTVRSVAEQLAGFGVAVQVLEPDSVRAELASIGAELLRAHGPPANEPGHDTRGGRPT